MKYRWLTFLVLTAASGCSSVKTTFVNVDQQGNLTPCPDRCVKGVPAIFQVHTHNEIKITQTDFWKLDGDSGKKSLIHLPSATLREAEVVAVMSDKMIMIDPKRPVSGTGEFGLKYDTSGTGHLTKVDYKAVDTTIKDTAALVTAALKVAGVKPNSVGGDESSVVKVTRVIAIERFPVEKCNQTEIERFVSQYVNNCAPSDCQTPTAYAPLPVAASTGTK